MTTTLRLRTDHLAKMRKLAGLTTNSSLAARMGVDEASVSRVLRGLQVPGPKFMAALVSCFDGYDLDDLFEVVQEDAA